MLKYAFKKVKKLTLINKASKGNLIKQNSEFKKSEQSPSKQRKSRGIQGYLGYKITTPLISNDVKISREFAALKRSEDLPSINEFLFNHYQLLKNKRNSKGTFAACEKTLALARDIINNDEGLSYVLAQPKYSTNKLGSIKVLISSITDFPEFNKIYQRQKKQEVMMCVGGPSASDQAVMSVMIPAIAKKLDKIIYATRNYSESNVAHSAKQYHIRHANALNADPALTGHRIFVQVVKRLIFGLKPKNIVASDFLKIDVKLTLNPRVLKIYLGNEINGIKQNIRALFKRFTEHDINRISAFFGGEFFGIMEEKIGVKLNGRKENQDLKHPSAIHVAFNKTEVKHANEDNKILDAIAIENHQLTRKEINEFFGPNNKIYRAFGYPSDSYAVFDIQKINADFAKKNGVEWHDDVEIKRILLTKDRDGSPKIAGVVNQKNEFIYVSKLHFSGGYMVDYLYDAKVDGKSLRSKINKLQNRHQLQKPLRNEMTTATGVSINAIFNKKRIGEISVTNSHWTKIAENEKHMLVRITGSGNTGSEEYNPAYALNVIANTRRIFGEDLVGIVSTYGCSRAVNSKNSTEWAKIAKGFVVSYGKGGTGNTKRHFEL